MKAKPIEVDGELFESARAAARYIVECEAKLGNTRKENTIAKELKRCWQGAVWDMYGTYHVLAPVESQGLEGNNRQEVEL